MSRETPDSGQPVVRRTLAALLEAFGAILPPEAVLVLPYGPGTSPRQREAAILAHQATHQAGAIVMPGRPDTAAYRLACPPGAVCGWVKGRVRFPGHATGAPFPTVVVYHGPDPRAFVRAFAPWGDCSRHVTRADLTPRKDTPR